MTKKGAVTLVVAGAVLTALLAWLFNGFGWWTAPGLIVAAVGVAALACGAVSNKGRCLGVGLCLVLIGLALLLAVLPHVMLGVLQIVSIVVMAAGLVLAVVGACKKKTCTCNKEVTEA